MTRSNLSNQPAISVWRIRVAVNVPGSGPSELNEMRDHLNYTRHGRCPLRYGGLPVAPLRSTPWQPAQRSK